MRPRHSRGGGGFGSGQLRVPTLIAVLIGLTIVVSIGSALAMHAGFPIGAWLVHSGERVWAGQLWRLVTWIFVESDPISLLFGVLCIWWFCPDLHAIFGWKRFLLVYLGLGIAGAATACLVGKLWPPALDAVHTGNWAVIDALIIMWALRFPDREIQLYFVIPVRGRLLVWITLAGTACYAAYYGLSLFIPHFAAEAIVLASGIDFRRQWLKLRQQKLKRQMRRYVDNVRRIDGQDDDDDDDTEPPAQPPRKWVN